MDLRNGTGANRPPWITAKSKSLGAIPVRSARRLKTGGNMRRLLSGAMGSTVPRGNFSTRTGFRNRLAEIPAIVFGRPVSSLYIVITNCLVEQDLGYDN